MSDRPNVLWVCADQLRADALGCYGNGFVDTPNVDRLAAEGVRFEDAYAQSPVCAPSRASFLTGRYPRTTGVRGNGHPIAPTERPVTKLLADDGYVCGLSGKLHTSPANPNRDAGPTTERRIDDGYSEFHWSHDPRPNWATNEYQHWLRERDVDYDLTPHPDSEYIERGMPPEHHQTTWCAQKAIDFVEDAAGFDAPWLYSVNFFDPHHSFRVPEGYLDRYRDRLDGIPLPEYEDGELADKPDTQRRCHEGAYNNPDLFPYVDMDATDHRLIRAAYWSMVDLIDDQVGRMLDALERTCQRDDTLVIFTSDHGELLGDHGIYLKGPFCYDQLLRVPLVVSRPGVVREGETAEGLVELTDLAPTVQAAAGRDPYAGMQGESLWPYLSGETEDHGREAVYAECYDPVAWEQDPPAAVTMVRTDDAKCIRWHNRDTGELYDLDADPGETENRWDDPSYADEKRELLELMTDRMAGTVDPLPEREAPW